MPDDPDPRLFDPDWQEPAQEVSGEESPQKQPNELSKPDWQEQG